MRQRAAAAAPSRFHEIAILILDLPPPRAAALGSVAASPRRADSAVAMRSSFVLAIAVAAACLVTVPGAAAYDNGLGAYPPLGWSTWCTDDLCGLIDKCTQQEIQSIADAFVSTGMTKLGYKWLVLDVRWGVGGWPPAPAGAMLSRTPPATLTQDCWAANTRTADGKLQADKEQFPDGMAALVDYVHARGLKIGLYTCAGNYTCHDHRPGSFGHYQVDAETFAGWDIGASRLRRVWKLIPSVSLTRVLWCARCKQTMSRWTTCVPPPRAARS